MRVEVVRYVRADPSPCLECVQLKLRLAHVRGEVAKVTKSLDFVAGVCVDRVKALVELDAAQHCTNSRDERTVHPGTRRSVGMSYDLRPPLQPVLDLGAP